MLIILGEEAGGAFVAGLRYGEGVLYTKDAGDQKVFWQGPSGNQYAFAKVSAIKRSESKGKSNG